MQTINYNKLGLKTGDVLLDLGCGEGRHVISAWLDADITAIGVDLSLVDVAATAEKLKPFRFADNEKKHFGLCVSDALNLPFADNSFDKVICSEVLEHIPDYAAALVEINRVLKPGGSFALSVPRFGPEWLCWQLSDEYHANEGGHLRIFKAKNLRAEVEQLQLIAVDEHHAHALHSAYWWLKCALWNKQEESKLIKAYHKLLVWDMMDNPGLTRLAEKIMNPLIGKSVVMYFRKPDATAATSSAKRQAA